MAINTDKLKDDAAGILNLLGKITPGGMAKSLAEKLQGNQAEIMKVIKKLLEKTPPGQAAKIVNFIVDRYKIPESVAARMVANEMTDLNEGFGPQGPDGTPDDGYRKNIGIDSGAEDYYDVPAMLSKNEFVFTADAVRGAGNGSIEKGAQKMYDTMKNLERRVT